MLYEVITHEGRLDMLQSKREDDAIGDENSGDGLLGRAKFIINHTPCREILYPNVQMVYNKIIFTEQGRNTFV